MSMPTHLKKKMIQRWIKENIKISPEKITVQKGKKRQGRIVKRISVIPSKLPQIVQVPKKRTTPEVLVKKAGKSSQYRTIASILQRREQATPPTQTPDLKLPFKITPIILPGGAPKINATPIKFTFPLAPFAEQAAKVSGEKTALQNPKKQPFSNLMKVVRITKKGDNWNLEWASQENTPKKC